MIASPRGFSDALRVYLQPVALQWSGDGRRRQLQARPYAVWIGQWNQTDGRQRWDAGRWSSHSASPAGCMSENLDVRKG